jgi:hypothetical protein
MVIKLNKVDREQIEQILTCPIWDGHLISKTSRDKLLGNGLVVKVDGYNCITGKGASVAYSVGIGGAHSPAFDNVLKKLEAAYLAWSKDGPFGAEISALMTAYDDWLD